MAGMRSGALCAGAHAGAGGGAARHAVGAGRVGGRSVALVLAVPAKRLGTAARTPPLGTLHNKYPYFALRPSLQSAALCLSARGMLLALRHRCRRCMRRKRKHSLKSNI